MMYYVLVGMGPLATHSTSFWGACVNFTGYMHKASATHSAPLGLERWQNIELWAKHL